MFSGASWCLLRSDLDRRTLARQNDSERPVPMKFRPQLINLGSIPKVRFQISGTVSQKFVNPRIVGFMITNQTGSTALRSLVA